MDTLTISDRWRVPLTCTRRDDGGIILRAPGKDPLLLSQSECERLVSFITGKPHIQRYPVMAPESP
jgi:hypothetical protein